ncbi:hypothetical protein BC826DRAFT_970098 [Russula brevipes]|nr:hypothetical protein BC826DRAFT_970098 [Russula brevipes]
MSPISTWKTTRNRGSRLDTRQNPRSYNDYLQEVEDIPFNLINEIDIPEMQVPTSPTENVALIELNQQRNEAYAQASRSKKRPSVASASCARRTAPCRGGARRVRG